MERLKIGISNIRSEVHCENTLLLTTCFWNKCLRDEVIFSAMILAHSQTSLSLGSCVLIGVSHWSLISALGNVGWKGKSLQHCLEFPVSINLNGLEQVQRTRNAVTSCQICLARKLIEELLKCNVFLGKKFLFWFIFITNEEVFDPS